ncbi:MAG: transferase [Chitinophaga sp.]|uniref:transferase n=1 Tax=Chitinophaga sp. TaxID=1869181 RepID=UPI0025BD7456|nr:transferase [Chitinophaga sp.]MBV8254798.1 transferase [Chitinophaga sp.]
MYLLIPGRHHLLTDFQFKYLNGLVNSRREGHIEGIIFAVTSANHGGTKRNPIPFYLRAMIIQEFSNYLDVPVHIYGIDDAGVIPNFTGYTLKTIRHASEGMHTLTPENTLVVCSTEVRKMYSALGFRILSAEWDEQLQQQTAVMPWDIVKMISQAGDWKTDTAILNEMHPAAYKIWSLYGLGDKVRQILKDPIIGSDGDLTATRDYTEYVKQMDDIAALKYRETAPYIIPGNIGDIGCAAGSWMKIACEDDRLHECDFYGIEVSRHLYDICLQRRHNGEFSNPSVFFAQKNAVSGTVFEPGAMHTIHTSSLTHEIASYGSIEDLKAFIHHRYNELQPGGVWINRDVTGPANRHETVLLWLNDADGDSRLPKPDTTDTHILASWLAKLSTKALFQQFAKDFRQHEGYVLPHTWVEIDGNTYCQLSMQDACEFLFTKDYHDNWYSEMHETFCFWNFEDWKTHLEEAGFRLDNLSHPYRNEWIVKNRLEGKVQLFRQLENGQLETIPFPDSHMLLLARK